MTQASWKNRRRMAWLAFGGLMLLVIAAAYRLAFVGDDPTNWTGIVSTLTAILGGMCISYSGFATWQDVKKGGSPDDEN